ncbi:MAG: HAD family hydrolase [Lachnospira sp.]|nr:HAD family hydrolase [Lachnospira sp.]
MVIKKFFDKTGTLTYGTPKVIKVESMSSKVNEEKLYAICASAELSSEHPLGKAVVRCFKNDHSATIPSQ